MPDTAETTTEDTGTETGAEETKTGENAEETKKLDPDEARREIAKANSAAASLRKRIKELEPFEKKAKELEDANKSETERLTEQLTAAEARAAKAELDHARVEVAAAKGLTVAQSKRLVGTTKDELEADADASIADGTFVVDGARRPKPDDDQGKESTAKGDPDAWLRDAARK